MATRRVPLLRLAHARSGDKGDTANIGLIALEPEYYPVLVAEVTPDRVKAHFQGICHGAVERFELPNLLALNFLLHESLGGGGTVSLKTDAQGKTLSTALLRMEIIVPEELAARALAAAPGESGGDSAPASVLIEETDGAVRGLILNRPEKRNALDSALVAALGDALRRADADPSVRVVTLQGAGTDFSAGADLAALRSLASAPMVENFRDAEALADLFLLFRGLGKPVVALVRGRALAGGCGLATACDLVLASDAATFGYTEIRLGFVPAIVMALLHRDLPGKRSFEILTSGSLYPAAEMERFGVVNRVFPDEEFDARAAEFVRTLASRSASAVTLTKRLLREQDTLTLEGAIRAGMAVNTLARLTDDARAGVAEFLGIRDGNDG